MATMVYLNMFITRVYLSIIWIDSPL